MKNYIKFLEGIMWYEDGKFIPEEDPKNETEKYDDFIHDDQFRQFLIDNNCYEQYLINFKKYKFEDECENIFSNLDRSDFIYSADAFIWQSTKEGYDYWFELSEKWREEIS